MNGTLHTIDGRPVLRFERRLAHPPEKVWRAITEPTEISQWYPFRVAAIDLRVGGGIRFDDGQGTTMDALITELDPPRVFAFSEHAPPQMLRESDDLVRFELRPDGEGCLLTFTHTFDDRPAAASYASGWQTCLDALQLVLDGRPVEMPDRPDWYVELHEEYVDRFGLGEGTLQQTADGWTVRFERQLPHPAEAVWAALTATDASTPEASDPTVGGAPPLQITNGFVPAGAVTAVERPALLEYNWQLDEGSVGRVRWELSGGPGGARVVVTQTGPKELADQRPTALAAWHTHLEILAKHLRGQDVCPWPEERTEGLRKHYAGLVG